MKNQLKAINLRLLLMGAGVGLMWYATNFIFVAGFVLFCWAVYSISSIGNTMVAKEVSRIFDGEKPN